MHNYDDLHSVLIQHKCFCPFAIDLVPWWLAEKRACIQGIVAAYESSYNDNLEICIFFDFFFLASIAISLASFQLIKKPIAEYKICPQENLKQCRWPHLCTQKQKSSCLKQLWDGRLWVGSAFWHANKKGKSDLTLQCSVQLMLW